MANTTNFGWETPDDTDLVKDGAAAMRTLGNSIDASFVDLKGGTTGQILAKASNTDLDFVWSNDAGISPTIFDAKADLLTATAADTPARLAVGANGTVLTADSAEATGLKWATVSSGGATLISTATPSAATTVSFTSIATDYKLLFVKFVARQSATNERFSVRLNNESGSIYNYTTATITGTNSTLIDSATGATSFGNTNFGAVVPYCSTSDDSDQAMGIFTIYDANLSQARHQVDWASSGLSNTRGFVGGRGYCDLATPAAISRIDFIRGGSQTITGTFYLYGVK